MSERASQTKSIDRLTAALMTCGIHFQPYDHGGIYVARFAGCPLATAETSDNHESSAIAIHPDGQYEFRCSHAACKGKSTADVFARLGYAWHSGPKVIHPLSLTTYMSTHTEQRFPIVEGLLYQRDIMNVVGSSKAKKSLLASQLALSIAGGKPFLGRATDYLGPLLYLDYELHPDTVVDRIKQQARALGISVSDRIHYHTMRGKDYLDLNELVAWLETMPKMIYSVVIVDALYRAFPKGLNENSNSDVTAVYNALDRAAQSHGCAFVVIHHASKGSQKDKRVADIGSGAGAQSRAVDCHLTLVEHELSGHVSMRAVVRACPPVEPAVLRCKWPLWEVVPEADAEALQVHEVLTAEQLAAMLPVEPTKKLPVLKQIHLSLNGRVSHRAIEATLEQAITRGLASQTRKHANSAILVCQNRPNESNRVA